MTDRSPAKLRLVATDEKRVAKPAKSSAAFLDDHELVASMRACDEGAAAIFYDRLRPRVELTIRRLLGRQDMDHEDVAQISMMALVEGIERYRGDCSLESWAGSVTAHVVYNHIRRRRLERRIFSSVAEEDRPEDVAPTSFGRVIVARNLVHRVREQLNEIDADKAWAFLLHDVCGFDLREIATITKVSVAAAQGRLVRGRREVHQRLAADPELAKFLTEVEQEA